MKLALARTESETEVAHQDEDDNDDDDTAAEEISGAYSFRIRASLPLPTARAVVVIGQGQVVTTIVLRALGWHVELAANVSEATLIAQALDATLIFVRISHSHLRSMRRPTPRSDELAIVAIVDSADDTPLPGFDATIAVDDVDTLAAYVRSVAPTSRSILSALEAP